MGDVEGLAIFAIGDQAMLGDDLERPDLPLVQPFARPWVGDLFFLIVFGRARNAAIPDVADIVGFIRLIESLGDVDDNDPFLGSVYDVNDRGDGRGAVVFADIFDPILKMVIDRDADEVFVLIVDAVDDLAAVGV